MKQQHAFMAFWFMIGLLALTFSYAVSADTYTFHDGFNQQFNDSNNWTLINRGNSGNNYSFITNLGRTILQLNIDPDGTNQPIYTNFNDATLLVRTLPKNFNFTEINITAVFDVSILGDGTQHGGIGFFNESADYSANLGCSSGRTPESYEYFYGQNKSSATSNKLWTFQDDYPSAFGDAGVSDDWVNHVLRLQLTDNLNGSYHIVCWYTNLGGLEGNSTIYAFGADKEHDVPAHLFSNLSFGVVSGLFNANEASPFDLFNYFDDFFVSATGTFGAGAPPEVPFGDLAVTLLSPSNAAALTNNQVSFSWSTNVSPANCSLQLNGQNNLTTQNTSVERFVADTQSGSWRVNCTTDSVNGSSVTRTFTVNTTIATDDRGILVGLTSPANGSTVTSNSVDFTYTANVSSNCSLFLNGVNNLTQASGSPFSRFVADTPAALWKVNCSSTYVQGTSGTFTVKVNTTAATGDAASTSTFSSLVDSVVNPLLQLMLTVLVLFFVASIFMHQKAAGWTVQVILFLAVMVLVLIYLAHPFG